MNKVAMLAVCSILLASCNTKQPATEAPKSDSSAPAAKEALVYPLGHRYSIDWQPGDEKNAVLVLTSLKKYCDGDVAGAMTDFADSVELIFDKLHFKGTKDSVNAMFTKMRADYKSITAEPDTWLTVYYPKEKDTWVTVWYTQKWTDNKGKVDSAYYTDDVLLKEGKIRMIDEKQRLFPPQPPPKK